MPEQKYQRLRQLNQAAPIATQIPHTEKHHSRTLDDPYHWLKDQNYPTVDDKNIIGYLEEENTYYQSFLKPNKPLVETIFEEFKGRTDEQETSVPYVSNGYEYQWYFRAGEEYRTRTRKNLATGEEAIFLDETALAKDHDYFVIGDWDISPDNRFLAYTFDTDGDERYQLRIKDLETDEYLDDVLNDVQGELEFNADGTKLMYALLEQGRWHSKNIKIHTIGEQQKNDISVYTEEDDGFYIGFDKTSSEEFMVIVSSQGEVEESHVLAGDFSGDLVTLVDRSEGFTQSVDHAHGEFYILANDTHSNFRLVTVSDKNPVKENWKTIIDGSDASYLLGLQTFKDFFVLKTRDLGLEKIHVLPYVSPDVSPDVSPNTSSKNLEAHIIEFPEPLFTAGLGVNPEFEQSFIRLSYESMITPHTVFDYDLTKRQLSTRKVQKIPSGYDKSQYETKRIMAPARDGVMVPVSLVYKKGFKQDGSHPMWLYGYGAYAATIEPSFSSGLLSALDRGFVYAIAHVRGGSMMSYQWYLDGKLKKRTNTFNDFVDVARHLVDEKYVSAGNISISGRSAGGELMGAAVIQAPELWRSVNLGVPFVDVLNTMLDASLPLTPPEWKEWGNPIESPEDYDLIASYSPYDNIEKREYPPMFVSGGINDPRVTYWEPAKWTARMRELKTDENLLVMRINMGAGHFSNSGRYGRLKDYAEEYAFMFLAHGIEE
ncbi:S9 family peptidase [Cocleimonas flava]|uniref:Oligopeptidase B n=1 Tax=Cocleimonas flava TaxID=634765 RepID=A0A4R1EX31_9GAMM|nr:S9 family peptidase [Cocleimonas flava]TCJ84534.1 oligopeptidase B [Cocleimonas flava]